MVAPAGSDAAIDVGILGAVGLQCHGLSVGYEVLAPRLQTQSEELAVPHQDGHSDHAWPRTRPGTSR